MKLTRSANIVLAAGFTLALTGMIAPQASADQLRSKRSTQTVSGFAATPSNGGTTARVPEHCNNVSSCNTMIAYCVGNGGDFEVRGSDGVGRPSKGTCTY